MDDSLFRSSHLRFSIRKGFLRNLTKFTGKELYQGLFFDKVIKLQAWGLKKEILARVFSREFCELSNNTLFVSHNVIMKYVIMLFLFFLCILFSLFSHYFICKHFFCHLKFIFFSSCFFNSCFNSSFIFRINVFSINNEKLKTTWRKSWINDYFRFNFHFPLVRYIRESEANWTKGKKDFYPENTGVLPSKERVNETANETFFLTFFLSSFNFTFFG